MPLGVPQLHKYPGERQGINTQSYDILDAILVSENGNLLLALWAFLIFNNKRTFKKFIHLA